MKPQKAYIIRISSEISHQYAYTAAKSCETLGIEYEYIDGIEESTSIQAWDKTGLKVSGVRRHGKIDKAACASASHALVWKRIYENKETAIILEHDAVMLHNVNLDIPDDAIIVLGYKLKSPWDYDHLSAGPPVEIINIKGHEGAHAYVINHVTAKSLLDDLISVGVGQPIDNTFFLNMRRTKVPISIANPIAALGWLRDSTIWKESSAVNYEFIPSFSRHYHG